MLLSTSSQHTPHSEWAASTNCCGPTTKAYILLALKPCNYKSTCSCYTCEGLMIFFECCQISGLNDTVNQLAAALARRRLKHCIAFVLALIPGLCNEKSCSYPKVYLLFLKTRRPHVCAKFMHKSDTKRPSLHLQDPPRPHKCARSGATQTHRPAAPLSSRGPEPRGRRGAAPRYQRSRRSGSPARRSPLGSALGW